MGNKRSKPEVTKKPAGPPDYKSVAFVTATFFVQSNTNSKQVNVLWENALDKSLQTMHMVDKSICIVDPEDHELSGKGKRIYGKKDFPQLFSLWKGIVHHENSNLFNINTPEDKPRRIQSTMMMGFSCIKPDVDEFLRGIITDLNRTKGLQGVDVNFEYQKFQALHCKRRIHLMNGPTKAPMSNYCTLSYELLSKLEKNLVRLHPDVYKYEIHGETPFPRFKVILDWGKGGNWKRGVKGEDTSFRKCPLFIYESKDEDRLITVVKECKRLEWEKEIFGEHAYFLVVPERPDDGQKDKMDNWIFNHGAVQKTLSDSPMPGLVKPDVKVRVELELLADGEPRPSPGSYSVRDILNKIWAENERVFQSLLKGWDGIYRAYYFHSSLCEEMALEISRDPASWLKVYLLRRGWRLSSVKRLIQKSFTSEAASASSHAKWDPKLKKVISGAVVQREASDRVLFAGSINKSAGYTASEAKAAADKASLVKATNSNQAELPEGDFGAFDYGDDFSAHTFSRVKSGPPPSGLSQASSWRPEARSTHSFGSKGAPGFELLSDER